MPKRKKTAAEVFDEAEENGWQPIANADVNGDRVSKPIEPGTRGSFIRTLSVCTLSLCSYLAIT